MLVSCVQARCFGSGRAGFLVRLCPSGGTHKDPAKATEASRFVWSCTLEHHVRHVVIEHNVRRGEPLHAPLPPRKRLRQRNMPINSMVELGRAR